MHKIFGEKLFKCEYKIRYGAYLISIRDNCLAVIENKSRFFLPGGGIDRNETHIDCIKRECVEELGYDVEVGNFICLAEGFLYNPTIKYFNPFQYYYSGFLRGKICEPIEPDHALAWLHINELHKLFLPMQEWAVNQFIYNKQ